jgi:katanin p80 WD40 repeat-containing subunit B1
MQIAQSESVLFILSVWSFNRDGPDEFFAHQGKINCVALAKWSATVFATGADDCVIHLWRLMKPQPVLVCLFHHLTVSPASDDLCVCKLQTLTGHTTEIDSLCFDIAEKSLISGSRGGSIKFWDMEAGKRTLNSSQE